VPSLAGAELRYAPALVQFGTPVSDEELASFSGATVGLCGRGVALRVCDPLAFQFATLPAPVKDVAFVDAVLDRRSALAATTAGPYFAPRLGAFIALDGGVATAPAWRPMALPGLSDACATTPAPIDRLFYDDVRRMLAATTDQDRRLSVFRRPFTEQTTNACAALAFDPAYGPCAACGPASCCSSWAATRPRATLTPRRWPSASEARPMRAAARWWATGTTRSTEAAASSR